MIASRRLPAYRLELDKTMTEGLRLNLGCGHNPKEGYVNVDKVGQPDVRHDLETFPWPWEDNSIKEVLLCHVLEHLGHSPPVFLGIMKELYRVCCPDARIHIRVPHPRHDTFLGDPTHVRPITVETVSLFSKRLNRQWIEQKGSNSTLGLVLDVDFEIETVSYIVDPSWEPLLKEGLGPDSPIVKAMRKHCNVVQEIRMVLKVVK